MFFLTVHTLQPFLVSREVCGETHYTATHVTFINMFNINLEVLHVFPLLVPSLLDAVGHNFLCKIFSWLVHMYCDIHSSQVDSHFLNNRRA